jgi:hypothetical protein
MMMLATAVTAADSTHAPVDRAGPRDLVLYAGDARHHLMFGEFPSLPECSETGRVIVKQLQAILPSEVISFACLLPPDGEEARDSVSREGRR